MKTLRRYSIGVALAALIVASAPVAHAVDPAPDTDDRVAIEEISADSVEISAPYLFHEGRYAADIDKVARWSCGLYKRVAVSISYSVSDDACDEIGEAAARRDPGAGMLT